MKSQDETSAVHNAAMMRDIFRIDEAVSDGNNVDTLDQQGRTALFYAVKNGEELIIRKLISLGANVNAQDFDFDTPLHFAARSFQVKAGRILIDSGAIVDALDIYGNTPLSRAVYESRGRREMIDLLISSGADRDILNRHGVSPRILAKTISNYNVAAFLD